MSWQKYDLVFRLLAPMHIGWRKVSNLQQTHGYVTGKVFWGALTARFTREAEEGAKGEAYQNMGDLVKKHFRFTYLYPALQNGGGYKIYYPWEAEDEFDYLFLDSYASTALNYASKSAEDGLLHETEFIAPRTRDNQPVYLKGSMYVRDGLADIIENWQPDSPISVMEAAAHNDFARAIHDALNKLQFGGERGYGWGRVQLVTPLPLSGEPVSGEPVSELVNGRLPAHLETTELNGLTVNGPIEPLTGWERNNNKNDERNWSLSQAEVCYAPGATVPPKTTLIITENSRLQLHNSQSTIHNS